MLLAPIYLEAMKINKIILIEQVELKMHLPANYQIKLHTALMMLVGRRIQAAMLGIRSLQTVKLEANLEVLLNN
jgi:hypothetical protein